MFYLQKSVYLILKYIGEQNLLLLVLLKPKQELSYFQASWKGDLYNVLVDLREY